MDILPELQLVRSEDLTHDQLMLLSRLPVKCPEQHVDTLIDYGIANGDQGALDEAVEAVTELSHDLCRPYSSQASFVMRRLTYMPTFRAHAGRHDITSEQYQDRSEQLALRIAALTMDNTPRTAQSAGELAELIALYILDSTRPSLYRECCNPVPGYNHAIQTVLGAAKVPIEIRLGVFQGNKNRTSSQVARISIRSSLPGLVYASTVNQEGFRLPGQHENSLRRRVRKYSETHPDDRVDKPLLDALINSITDENPAPEEIVLQQGIRLYWQRRLARFCLDQGIGTAESQNQLREMLAHPPDDSFFEV